VTRTAKADRPTNDLALIYASHTARL
jgi:hypothetical protein